MTDPDIERLLQQLTYRVPDDDQRSAAMEAFVAKRPQWSEYTPKQWLNFCLRVAWIERAKFWERTRYWGTRSTRERILPPRVKGDSLTPLRMLEIKRAVGRYGSDPLPPS